jgi:hypothetical protein
MKDMVEGKATNFISSTACELMAFWKEEYMETQVFTAVNGRV